MGLLILFEVKAAAFALGTIIGDILPVGSEVDGSIVGSGIIIVGAEP